jgi:lipopolysaccharide export system protein LptA
MKAAIAQLTTAMVLVLLVTGTWAVSKEGALTFRRSPDQEIKIQAEKGTLRSIPGGWETVFGKNVRVKQGDVTLTCDRLTVEYVEKKGRADRQERQKDPIGNVPNNADIKTIVASGNVKIVQGDRRAFAGKAVYDNAARTITLTGEPRLWQGGNTVTSETIIMYLDQKRTEFPTPVKGVFQPGKNQKEKEK